MENIFIVQLKFVLVGLKGGFINRCEIICLPKKILIKIPLLKSPSANGEKFLNYFT